jgi:hypothetical protein
MLLAHTQYKPIWSRKTEIFHQSRRMVWRFGGFGGTRHREHARKMRRVLTWGILTNFFLYITVEKTNSPEECSCRQEKTSDRS